MPTESEGADDFSVVDDATISYNGAKYTRQGAEPELTKFQQAARLTGEFLAWMTITLVLLALMGVLYHAVVYVWTMK